jgi:polysaccharide chain length determinant protein (PEP-CTERM system associated)
METPEYTLADLKTILRRRAWSIFLPFIVVFTIVTAVALLMPPVYKSTSTILIEQQDIPADFVKATVSTYAEQQMQIINQRIMSSNRLLDIINRFNLYADLRDREPTEEIIARMHDDIKLEPVSVDVVDPKTGRPTTATIAFTLSYEGKKDPQKVFQVANVLASLFLEENAVTRERQASEVSKFLEAELAKVKADLAGIDGKIAQFKAQHVNDLPELVQVNMQGVNDTERNIDMLMSRITQLREKEGALKSQLANTPPEFGQADRQRLNELKVQLVNLKQHFSDEHPDVIKTKAEIAELENQLRQAKTGAESATGRPDNPAYITLASDLSSVQSEIASSNAQLADLQRRLAGFKRSIVTTPQVETDYKALLMERSNTQAKYDDLMRKVMEARVSQGLEKEQKGERFTIIDPAKLPEQPYKPNRPAIILIGFVLALGAGAGTGAFMEFSDRSVHSAEALAMLTSFPVLATIPEMLGTKEAAGGKVRWMVWAVCLVILLIICITLFHFFVMDLDIFWAKLLRRTGI